jgi:hypothetical protein
MKPHTIMKNDEIGFPTFFVVFEFFIVPSLQTGKYGGGITMLATSLVGLLAYCVLFGERLCSRGQSKLTVVILTVSAFIAAAIVAALQPFER